MLRTCTLLAIVFAVSLLSAHPSHSTNIYDQHTTDYYTRADSAHGFDVQHYMLDLLIDTSASQIYGMCIATIVNEQALDEIEFELEQLDVGTVLVNGAPTTCTYDDHVITIDLPTIPIGQEYTVTIEYSGQPTLSNDIYGIGMFFMNTYLFTISDPSGVRWWMPAYDHPWDKAVIDFVITTRDDWKVACNGLRTSIVDNGDGTATTTWEGQNEMAPHLFVVHAGDFMEYAQSYGDLPLLNFIPENHYNNAVEDFSNLPFMVETFESMYGTYPWEKYGNVVVNMQTFGAMEHQTMTTMGNSYINGQHSGEQIIAHELAHQWFGNCLTPLTWRDVWLSEGFATYSEVLYTQAWQGWEESVDYLTTEVMNYYKGWAGGTPHTIYDPSFNNYFAPPQYEKAASVLHMLRFEVGDDLFFEILQTWFETYHGGWVVTQEFEDMVEQVTGEEWDWYFDQWIYGEGLPAVDYAFFFNRTNPGQFKCSAQTSSNGNGVFELHVPIMFTNADGDVDSTVVYAVPEVTAYEADPVFDDWTSYQIDPHSWILSRYHDILLPDLVGAYAADGAAMLQWTEFRPDLLLTYNIYRADSPDGEFVQINTEPIDALSYTDNTVTNGQTYYYTIKAVYDSDWETEMSNVCEATPMAFPLDRGVLLVDETQDGAGTTPISPTDEMVDSFYAQTVHNPFRAWDYASEGAPPIDTLAHYSTVFWIDDDVSNHNVEDNLQALGNYVLGGGNLVMSGWKTAQEIPANFLASFLTSSTPQLWTQAWCSGATSTAMAYPMLEVDPDKLLPNWNNQLAYVVTFPDEENNVIYLFEGENEPVNQPCAIKSNPGGAFVLLGFPLYYMQSQGVSDFCDALLTEFGELVSVDPEPEPLAIGLQIYPNPLVSGQQNLNIQLSLPVESEVEARVYNIRGQRVASLINEKLPAGQRSLRWDARDDSGARVGSGVYLLHVKHSLGEVTRKVLLLK